LARRIQLHGASNVERKVGFPSKAGLRGWENQDADRIWSKKPAAEVDHSSPHAPKATEPPRAQAGTRACDELGLPPDNGVILREDRHAGVKADGGSGIIEIPAQKRADPVRNLIGIGERQQRVRRAGGGVLGVKRSSGRKEEEKAAVDRTTQGNPSTHALAGSNVPQ
jgi:hypothetical protein